MEKKNKVRTCGNCAYLEIRDKKRYYYYYRAYVCVNEDADNFITWRKPSNLTDCPYHKFKNNNYNE